MIILIAVFLSFAAYGFFSGNIGAALISLVLAVFCEVARRVFARQEQRWLQDPASAKAVVDTETMLDKQDCECTSSRF